MAPWSVGEPETDEYVGNPPTPLASLVYIAAELRRRWRTWAVTLLLGLCLAGLYMSHYPPKSTATIALVLQHPSGTDPAAAMQTDLAILETREVAGKTLAALDDDRSVADFQQTYAGTATTSDILTISVKAASPGAAVKTAQVLASTYLHYRAGQMEASTTAQIAGVKNQIASLRQQLSSAQAQYQQFKNDRSGTSVAGSALQQVTSLRSQIGSLQAGLEATQNATAALIDASDVLDPAAVVPSSRLKSKILTTFSGVVGGLGVGWGIVTVSALTTTRLRRRQDIALAAAAPVTHSVRRLGGRSLAPLPQRSRRRTKRRAFGLQVLAQGLETVTQSPGGHRTALVTLGNEDDGLLVAAFAGAQLSSDREHVFLVDLSESGRLEKRVRRAMGAAVRPALAPTVYRPEGPPVFAQGPLTAGRMASAELAANDPMRARWDAADVVIAVTPVDLDAGLDHVAGWAQTAVLLVTAGRSTAEEISSAAGLLRSAGVELRAVLMVGSHRTDQSFGRGEPESSASIHQRDGLEARP